MSEVSERYRRLADAFAARLAAVPEDKWSSPSPCEDWTIRDLVAHV
ncbi:MAG: maleylpyruvate isomerase N-terminal domain-containing protein, partial [Actinobacteria bacterium]|nr:maleylpyruvate isomerase N-terminal domain-containing protein [Actinomycetota bacterium]